MTLQFASPLVPDFHPRSQPQQEANLMEADLKTLVLGGIARHVLTGAAGFLVAAGALAPNEQNQFIGMGVGIALWAAGVAWSWWQKNGHAELLTKLKRTGATAGAIGVALLLAASHGAFAQQAAVPAAPAPAPAAAPAPVVTKARAAPATNWVYPYSGSGGYWGVSSLATQSSPTVDGATATGLQSFGGSLGGVGGYRWGNGNVAIALEASFYWNNIGGSAVCNGANCTVSSNWSSVERVKFIVPSTLVTSLFPNLGLPSVPTFTAPAGSTVTTTHFYLFGGLKPDDVSAAAGLATGHAWTLSPGLGAGTELQLNTGAVVDIWAGYFNPAQGISIGLPQGYATPGRQLLGGLSALF
jgi:hypothetical protein